MKDITRPRKYQFSRTHIKFSLGLLVLWGLSTQVGCSENKVCQTNEQCRERFNSHYDCDHLYCERAKLGTSTLEIAGEVLIFFISALANAGGIGGGPTLVTALVTMLKF